MASANLSALELKRHLGVRYRTAWRLKPINADHVQVQQVLTNFVRNAIEAIKVGARSVRRITLSTRAVDASRVSLAVEDTGPGFADHQRAFEAFYTTKEHGMGMGLAICRTIAEAHGGTIAARNILPYGACVELFLPATGTKDVSSLLRREL